MKYLLSAAMLLMTLAPRDQKLPVEFQRIPEQLRQRATIIVAGTYGEGRTPCLWMPDGSREWLIDPWFEVRRVYRGEVGSNLIRINTAMLPANGYFRGELKRGRTYLVLLRPDEDNMKSVKGEGLSFWDALSEEEIIAIVELRTLR